METEEQLNEVIDTNGSIGIKLGKYHSSPFDNLMNDILAVVKVYAKNKSIKDVTGSVLDIKGTGYMFSNYFVDQNDERYSIQVTIKKDRVAEDLKELLDNEMIDEPKEEYKSLVEEDFKKRGFTESTFKDKDEWSEVLDPSWDWDTFEYRIPQYEKSKSIDEYFDKNRDIISSESPTEL